MTLTKKMLAGLCAVTLCSCFASCGSTESSSDTQAAGADASSAVEVKELDEEDKQTVSQIAEKLDDTELEKNNVVFDRSSNNWKTRGDGTAGEGIGSGMTLFIPVGLWGIEGEPENVKAFGNVEEGDIMLVPMPGLDDSDTHYVTARADGYFLCQGAPNPEGFAAYMNCRMAAFNEAGEIGEKQLREVCKRNKDMIDMHSEIIRLVNEHPVFDFQDGVSDEFSDKMLNVRQSAMLTGGGAITWSEAVSSNNAAVDYLLKEANESIEGNK